MTWKYDEARRRVFEALLVLTETTSEEETIALLSNELARISTLREFRRSNAENLRLTARIAELEDQLSTAMDTIGVYATESNYTARAGSKSQIEKDRGRRARNTLSALSGEDATDGEAE